MYVNIYIYIYLDMATYCLLLCTIWAQDAKETHGAHWAVWPKCASPAHRRRRALGAQSSVLRGARRCFQNLPHPAADSRGRFTMARNGKYNIYIYIYI